MALQNNRIVCVCVTIFDLLIKINRLKNIYTEFTLRINDATNAL